MSVASFPKDIVRHTDLEKTLHIACQSPDELAQSFFNSGHLSWTVDQSWITERPVIRLIDDRFTCPEPMLLLAVMNRGVLRLLEEAIGRNAAREVYGYLFEEYIGQILDKVFNPSDLLAKQCWASPRYEKDKIEVADHVFQLGDRLALVECKATRLGAVGKLGGVAADLFQGIDSALKKEGRGAKGVFQLARNAGRLFHGEKVLLDGTPASALGIIPILVVDEECIACEAVRKYLDDALAQALKKESVPAEFSGPLLLLGTEDVEYFFELSRHGNAFECFDAYVRSVGNKGLQLFHSFKDFANDPKWWRAESDPAVASRDPGLLDALLDELMARSKSANCAGAKL